MDLQLTGYRRQNGQVGVRNYVLIIPIDDISNACVEGIASLIRGTYALTHPYGRLQFGDDLDLTMNTLIGTGSNANIAGCIVIGIEPKWTEWVANGIAKTGKPVESFSIERYGDLKTIEMASRAAMKMVQYATELQREPISLGDLIVSAKCGESDTTLGLASNPAIGRVFDRMLAEGATAIFGETSETTGAEDKIADACINDEVRLEFLKTFQDYQDFIIGTGADLLGSQPTQGNIRGGLSTIEEKALGNVAKMGKCQVTSVLKPAQAPAGPGLHFMDSSSAAAEMVTLCAAGGSVLHFFTTGQGNIIGNPIIPVMKISANPLTVSTMPEHIDVDITAMLRLEMTLDQAADAVMEEMARNINGRLTAAEVLRHEEFVITKLFRSA